MRHHDAVPSPLRPALPFALAFAFGACATEAQVADANTAAPSPRQDMKAEASQDPPSTPKLVVVLVVDQMRAEMLDRYGPHYQHGFRRLLDGGVRYTRARHAHAVTYTAPGHATLATGTHPSVHGIAGNSWVDTSGSRQYAAADPAVAPLGAAKSFPGAPTWLERETLGDWLQNAHPEAKVWSLALKDRAAIMMGGKHPDGTLWWNDEPPRYVSSRHYFEALPTWVDAFTNNWSIEERITIPWPKPERLLASRAEDAPDYEGPFAAFPHTLEHFWGKPGPMARYTPRGEEMNFALARELIENEGLGDDEQADILWLGASASDWIGHRFGPRSHEMEAHQLALDESLGEFLEFLDQRFPQGDYLLVLSSDHGANDIPESLAEAEEPGRRIDGKALVTKHFEAIVSRGECPRGAFEAELHTGVTLRPTDTPKATESSHQRCLEALATELSKQDWVVETAGPKELLSAPAPGDSPFLSAARRSYFPGRSAELFVHLPPHHMFAAGYKTGTRHGTSYTYDQDVPLVFFSPRLEPATRDEAVLTVDLAPTLAPILRVALPPDLSGKAIPSMAADFARAGWPSGPRQE
jgi:predicted AlkP superfamily pyrophosphatase or phosphodiesterase